MTEQETLHHLAELQRAGIVVTSANIDGQPTAFPNPDWVTRANAQAAPADPLEPVDFTNFVNDVIAQVQSDPQYAGIPFDFSKFPRKFWVKGQNDEMTQQVIWNGNDPSYKVTSRMLGAPAVYKDCRELEFDPTAKTMKVLREVPGVGVCVDGETVAAQHAEIATAIRYDAHYAWVNLR